MTLGSGQSSRKAFRFTNLILSDRSATFRGEICPSSTNRIASEVYAVVKDHLSRSWWEPVRRAVLRFADVKKEVMDLQLFWEGQWTPTLDTSKPDKVAPTAAKRMPIVVSYIVRSGHRRTLRPDDHTVRWPKIRLDGTCSNVLFACSPGTRCGTHHSL